MIKDSGTRRRFDSGAVRDCAEGKGRCDLLPLDIVCLFYDDDLLGLIHLFEENGDVEKLIEAIKMFINMRYEDTPTALLEVSIQYEEGGRKYGDTNWRKGIPLHCYIDSAIRHYLKWLRGDNDEPHDRAVLWNLIGALWTAVHREDLVDLIFTQKDCLGKIKESTKEVLA